MKAVLDQGTMLADFEEVVGYIAAELERLLASADLPIVHNVTSPHKNLALTAAMHLLTQAGDFTHPILWHHDLAWSTLRYAAELHPCYPGSCCAPPGLVWAR